MATQTTNLHLTKPDGTEKVNIATINTNMDTIDTYVGTNNASIINLAEDIGVVVNGNKTKSGVTAAVGQYVILKNSTISNRVDGLYTAAKAIPANTAIDASYLTAVSGGGLNALNAKILSYHVATDVSLDSIQSSLATLGASMQDGDVRSIDFSVAPAEGVFAQARTFGFIRRISGGRYLVSVQQGQTGGKTITGYLFNNVWSWESVSDKINDIAKLQYGINALDTNIGVGETITKTYNFPNAYSTNSVVIPQVVWYGVPNALHWQLLATTVSGFTIRIKNDHTAAIPASDISIRWIAFGN